MLNIILFGAPGCGKGTQSALLEQKYDLSHISTGDIIRQEIKSGSEIGKEFQACTEKGELAPDSLVIDIIQKYLSSLNDCKGTIFDGFPRTTAQAEAFDKMLSKIGEEITVMVYMDVPDDELVKRILLRGKDSGRKDDQSEEIIRNRIKVYKEQTLVVADYYRKQNKYAEIPSLGTIDEVFNELRKVIENYTNA
ncbi:MAG: adenylate kinase [Alistipes sp.]|nr:adenylate kinase [Candidatus Alistipes equi]